VRRSLQSGAARNQELGQRLAVFGMHCSSDGGGSCASVDWSSLVAGYIEPVALRDDVAHERVGAARHSAVCKGAF
jgi:hypothetical protein